MSRFEKLSFKNINTYSIKDRFSKVKLEDFASITQRNDSLENFYNSLPTILIGKDFKEFVKNFRKAIDTENTIIIMMGAHVIKCGLSPLIINLIDKKIISHLAMNGACVIHDVEIANWGVTSEDVAEGLKDGSFGMASETADFINSTLEHNLKNSKGYGEVIGEKIISSGAKNKNLSILAACVKGNIPFSVHSALGTEIIHQHPNLSGEAFGNKSLIDFQIFTNSLTHLQKDSIVLNIGSAVILPEVFLKALTIVRNLGYPAHRFYTAVFDIIRHYRPAENVQIRPTLTGGKGYYFVGHHEIMLPLLLGLLLD
jgi:hypothetical protein